MPRTRVLKAAPSPAIFTELGALRMTSGSMGAGGPPGPQAMPEPMPMPMPDGNRLADGPDDDWAGEIARREAAAGVATAAVAAPAALNPDYVYDFPARVAATRERPPADLTPLPDRFALDVERKPDGWWVVRAPGVHPGLFCAHQDLATALSEAPEMLAEIVRLDGVVARKGKRPPQ